MARRSPIDCRYQTKKGLFLADGGGGCECSSLMMTGDYSGDEEIQQ